MNYIIKYRKLLLAASMLLVMGCTSNFEDLNTDPTAVNNDEASAKFFLTEPQFQLYAPNRFPYWRAQLIHADRYAGHFNFGHHGSWWSGNLSYNYNSSYTDASWDWMSGYIGQVSNFLKLTESGGSFENEKMYAVGLIMKGLYYQMFTDAFGRVPYTEAGNTDILFPKYDDQATIYKGVLADLDMAMSIIGSDTVTGVATQDLGANDLYFGGDLQKWKKLANALKLRMGIRAEGAAGAGFAATAINQALADALPASFGDNALLPKDTEISQWNSAAYGDVWHNFGGLGSKWTVGEVLVNYMRDNADPRLSKYFKPATGGSFTFTRPDAAADPDAHALFPKRIDYIEDLLSNANASYTRVNSGDDVTISLAPGTDYIGQPARLNGKIKPYARFEFFATPNEEVVGQKNTGSNIWSEVVFTTAEAYFLQAEAALKGYGGNAQAMHEEGIRQAMELWGVDAGSIDNYIANSALAMLNGTMAENLEKVAIQRWIAAYTDGFEAWAIVRDTGYPSELAGGVSDYDIFDPGTIPNGDYPQRMRYGNNAYNLNGDNVMAAVAAQGPDNQGTELWWAN